MAKTVIVSDDTFGEGWGKQNLMSTEVYIDVAANAASISAHAVRLATNESAITALEEGGGDFDLASPGRIGETTPSTIRQVKQEIYVSSSSNLVNKQCSGVIVNNMGMTDADCDITMPPAIEGLGFLCHLTTVRAKYFRLVCESGQHDKIHLLTDGEWVSGSENGYVGVASGYSESDEIRMYTVKVSDGSFEWFAVPVAGTRVAGVDTP